jgi:hypothetical protein
MKRELRRAHRAIFIILAILLPLLVAAGLWARRPPAVMEELPPPLTIATPDNSP